MSRKAYVGFGAKRMSDLAQSVCRIWRKAYVGFGAKRMPDLAQSVGRIWRKTFLEQNVFGRCPGPDVGRKEIVIGAIYTADK